VSSCKLANDVYSSTGWVTILDHWELLALTKVVIQALWLLYSKPYDSTDQPVSAYQITWQLLTVRLV